MECVCVCVCVCVCLRVRSIHMLPTRTEEVFFGGEKNSSNQGTKRKMCSEYFTHKSTLTFDFE